MLKVIGEKRRKREKMMEKSKTNIIAVKYQKGREAISLSCKKRRIIRVISEI